MLLEGKTGLILGIANKRSLAWGIAQSVAREGARLAVTYQGERLEENVRDLAAGLERPVILPCDVSKDEDLDVLAESVKKELGGLDFVVHAVAYALREELDGEFLNTSREGYRMAQDISSYSLTALARRMVPLMEGRGGSIVTLSYLGGERVVPHYNVMGVAKAALEMLGALPGRRPRTEGHPRQRHLRRPDQDAGRLRRARHLQDARVPPHPRPAAEEHRAGRGGRRRAVPRLAPLARDHGRAPPRRRRVPRHGNGGGCGLGPPVSGRRPPAPSASRWRRG